MGILGIYISNISWSDVHLNLPCKKKKKSEKWHLGYVPLAKPLLAGFEPTNQKACLLPVIPVVSTHYLNVIQMTGEHILSKDIVHLTGFEP